MLTVHHSNRLEILADRLAQLLATPAGSPLAPEWVVVQSNGMARWLSLRIAQQLGVCANLRFPFPAALVWNMFRQILPQVPDTSAYAPEVLAWRLLDLLADLDDPRFAPVRAWLGDGDDTRRFELARRVADVFDQYLVYRPRWLLDWEAGQGSDFTDPDLPWQGELWRRLAAQDGGCHRARLAQDFFERADPNTLAQARLPARLALFGIPVLPPMYLDVFRRLAEVVDVHLFLLNPCQYYWGDIVAERDQAHRAGEDQDPAELYLETGNPLLASLGKQGRDFIDQVAELPGQSLEDWDDPLETGDSLLQTLQGDILDLRDRGREGVSRVGVAATDSSVQIHACHSPMREVEVLHDQLLALFQAHPELSPAEVAVLTPDIEQYAPLIEAVFSTAPAPQRIPYSIADRESRAESPLVDGFFALLELAVSRFDANRVLALLETPAVRRRFGLVESDLTLIHGWVRATGIRWGIDSQSRAALDLPAVAEHSWRAGLDRLLLGYALPGGEDRLYGEILPYDAVEGSAAQAMGRLHSFTEALFQLHRRVGERRAPGDWTALLLEWLDAFFAPEGTEQAEAQALRAALEAVAAAAEQGGYREPVALETVLAALEPGLAEAASGGRFLAGGVTFCAMVPMRSIPFQVICLIGMNDGAYPRSHRPADFDLMAAPGRYSRGDRSRRADDRYLFLEVLISVRRALYLSFVGNNIRDNSVIPPSVLISELLDLLRRGFHPEHDPDGDVVAQLLTRHPLQAFSHRYFTGDSRLFSFSGELCEASRVAGRGRAEQASLFGSGLPEPGPEWETVDLDRLIGFFANPTGYLLRRRLNLRLEESEGLVETREPFILDNRQCRELRRWLLERQLNGQDLALALPLARAAGKLPHGQVGETLYQRERAAANLFAQRLRRFLPDPAPEPLSVDLELAGMRLVGRLAGVSPDGLKDFRVDRIRPRDYLALWLRHLVLNCLVPEGVARHSQWLGEDRVAKLAPVAEPQRHLAALLALYRQGLCWPLRFFPRSAWAYAQALENPKADPLAAARTQWEGNDFVWAERLNAHYRLAFRDLDPLDEEFQRLAETVFKPLLAHLEDHKA